MRTPVRLEFSCYPEAELTNLLTDGKIDLILTGTRPDADARRFSGTPATSSVVSQSGSPAGVLQLLSVHPFTEVLQVLLFAASHPKTTDISEFRNDTFLFSETDPAAQSSQNLYPIFQDLGFAPKIRFAANLSTILDLTAQDEGVYLTHAWCRGCKNPEYRTLILPSEKEFYLLYTQNTLTQMPAELLRKLRAL